MLLQVQVNGAQTAAFCQTYFIYQHELTLLCVVAELQELCLREEFTAQCPSGHVILITRARYGRIHMGRCVKRNFGELGCYQDVISMADKECSGRQKCIIDVFKTFQDVHPCPELESYFEVDHTCLKGNLSALDLFALNSI